MTLPESRSMSRQHPTRIQLETAALWNAGITSPTAIARARPAARSAPQAHGSTARCGRDSCPIRARHHEARSASITLACRRPNATAGSPRCATHEPAATRSSRDHPTTAPTTLAKATDQRRAGARRSP